MALTWTRSPSDAERPGAPPAFGGRRYRARSAGALRAFAGTLAEAAGGRYRSREVVDRPAVAQDRRAVGLPASAGGRPRNPKDVLRVANDLPGQRRAGRAVLLVFGLAAVGLILVPLFRKEKPALQEPSVAEHGPSSEQAPAPAADNAPAVVAGGVRTSGGAGIAAANVCAVDARSNAVGRPRTNCGV